MRSRRRLHWRSTSRSQRRSTRRRHRHHTGKTCSIM
jgi:hypothetical protein